MTRHKGKYILRDKAGEIIQTSGFSIEVEMPENINIPNIEDFLLQDLFSIEVTSIEEIK